MTNKYIFISKSIFIVIGLFFYNLLYAENCIQKPTFAMSPYKLECVEFDSSCDVPKDWIKLNSCDLGDITKGMHNVDASNVRDATIKMRDAINSNGDNVPTIMYPNGRNGEKRSTPGGMRFYEQSD